MKKILFFYFIIFQFQVFGQCFTRNSAFKEGEKITYSVYYNWAFIWVDAGWVEFKVDKTTYNNHDVYFLDAYGSSHKGYDWFYKVRDSFKSYLDYETLEPLWFERKTSEGGYDASEIYFFYKNQNKVYSFTENSNRPYKKDTLYMPTCSFDVLTLIYYARNIDFSTLKPNDKVPVTVIIDNEFFDLYIRYLGKETIETKNGEKFRCLKFSSLLVEGTIFKGGEDLFGWVTDDANRVPVLVEAKILVGSVKAYLNHAEGLRNKVTSKVEE